MKRPQVARFVCVDCGARVIHREKGGARRKRCRPCARTKRTADSAGYWAWLCSREAG